MPKTIASSEKFDFDAIGLGERIKAARKALGITQAELAESMDMDRASGQVNLTSWESGNRRPSIEAFCRLCIALDCNPDDLLRLPLKKQGKRKPRSEK